MKMSSRVRVHKYLTEYLLTICLCVLSCFVGVLFCCMPWSISDKRRLLTYMQHTRKLTCMQHRKHYSCVSCYRASHEQLLACSAWKIACIQYTKVDSCAAHFVSHACFDSRHNKNWRTHACSPHVSVNLDVSCTVAIWQNAHTIIKIGLVSCLLKYVIVI